MRVLATLLAVFCLAACDMPRDPEGTLDRVRGGILRVGVVEQAPWIRSTNGEPDGAEAVLVRELARELGATVEWHPGGETDLLERLEKFELDLVVGGITRATPWASRLGMTLHYAKLKRGDTVREHVFAAPPGENAWLLTLDRFLYKQRGRAEQLLQSEAAP